MFAQRDRVVDVDLFRAQVLVVAHVAHVPLHHRVLAPASQLVHQCLHPVSSSAHLVEIIDYYSPGFYQLLN